MGREVTLPKVTGAVAVLALGTLTFWHDHQDAIIVFFGFSILILAAMFIVARMDNRIQNFQEQQVKALRTHIARFYIMQRRRNKSFEHRIIDLEEITRTVESIDRNCAARSARNDALRSSIGALNENQKNMRDHFHERLAKIEYKMTLSHDKAIVQLTLKGVIRDEP